MKKSKNRQKALSLFSKEALNDLKRSKFNGRLSVIWKDGVIKDFNMKMNLRYFVGKDGEDFFMEEF